ncbi:MAG: CPBP family intramembrane metalloprotease [Chitinophagaceae bacterium]|nr:CPBP family intramembrane metalloprotease [Chitinophagaceae bacterium]
MFAALLRCILFWILFEILLFGTGNLSWFVPTAAVRWMQAFFGVASAIVLVYLFLRIEKKSLADIGLTVNRKTPLRFAGGIIIGTIIIGCILALLLGLSELTINVNPVSSSPAYLIPFYLLIVPFAYMEELAFRSYTMARLNNQYGIWLAQFVSSIAFALYHVVSGWTWYIAFLGPFIWAFIFGLSALWSGGIAMPTGIHAALNIWQVVLGMKGGEAAFFVLKLKEQHQVNAQQKLDSLGVAIHIIIFLLGILATRMFVRRRHRLPDRTGSC